MGAGRPGTLLANCPCVPTRHRTRRFPPVSHPNPYPYYAGLVKERPLYWDEAVGAWVASSAAAVTAVLSSDALRVRPAAEPVPAALGGSASAALFGRLLRMTDGAAHPPLKGALLRTLGFLEEEPLAALARASAETLAKTTLQPATPRGLEAFAFGLSVHVLSSLLGLPETKQGAAQEATEAYLSGLGAAPARRALSAGPGGGGVARARRSGPGQGEALVASRALPGGGRDEKA